MKPIIALNLKVYKESLGNAGIRLCEISSEVSLLTGVRIIVCPQYVDLAAACKVSTDVFAQHVDAVEPGAHTGTVIPEAIKEIGCKGSLLNHAERKIPHENVKWLVEKFKTLGLESMVCAKDAKEAAALAVLKPNYIAVEPPELIGSGVSVSTARPEVVRETIEAVKKVGDVPVLCGAGVSNASDVKRAIELGSEGVLLASAYVKAKDPKALLLEMANAIK